MTISQNGKAHVFPAGLIISGCPLSAPAGSAGAGEPRSGSGRAPSASPSRAVARTRTGASRASFRFFTLCVSHTHPRGVCRGQQVCPGLGSSGTPPLPRLLALRAAAGVLGTRSGYERRWGAGGRAGVTGCFRKLSVLVMPLSVSQRARLGSLPTACQPPWQPGD